MKKPSCHPYEGLKLCNSFNEHYTRFLHGGYTGIPLTVYYHPEEGRWFTTLNNSDQQEILTKVGRIRLCDIQERMNAIIVSFPCFEDKNEIMIVKDESGRFAVLTMSPNDLYYGSDRNGFGYKTVHLYFDTWTRPLEGSVHYLTTRNLDGKWDLVWICCPQHYDEKNHVIRYNLGIERKWLIKGCDSENKALQYLAELGGPVFNNTKRYVKYDLTSNTSQNIGGRFCEINGNIMTVSAFYSYDSYYQRVSICMWPTNKIRSAYKVKDNEALVTKITRMLSSDDYYQPVNGFHEILKEFSLNHGISFRVLFEEESKDPEEYALSKP